MRYSLRHLAASALLALSVVSAYAQNKANYINLSNPTNESNSYAVTDFPISPKTKIQTHVMFMALSGDGRQDLFGTARQDGGPKGRFHFIVNKDHFQANYGGNYANIDRPTPLQHYYIGMDKSGIFVDLTEGLTLHDWTASFAPADISAVGKMYIGSNGNPEEEYRATSNGILNANYYDFCVFDDNTLTHHFIPAFRDGAYQFYDTRHDTYLPTHNAKGYVARGDSCEHRYVEVLEKGIRCKICDEAMSFAEWMKTRHEDFGLTAMDPYLDVQADSAHAGQQTAFLSGQSPISRIIVADSATNTILVNLNLPRGENSITLPLPATSQRRTLYALARTTYGKMNGTQQDTSLVYAPVTIRQKPYHTICAMQVVDSVVIDTTRRAYTALHRPCIRMAMDGPTDEDVLSSDMFILQRAYQPDFSDGVNMTTLGMSSFTEQDKTIATRCWATYIDESEGAQYTTNPHDSASYSFLPYGVEESANLTEMERAILRGFYEYPDRRIYYRVVRATVMSAWPQHLAEDSRSPFVSRQEAKTANVLPIVTGVSVEQTDGWLRDKRVRVTVRLHNPLPWEYNELLDSAKVVREIGWKNLYRRYTWPTDSKARIRVQRYSPASQHLAGGEDEALKEYVINDDQVKWDSLEQCFKATILDCQSLPFLLYYYKAQVEVDSTSLYPVDRGNVYVPSSDEDAQKCYSSTLALIQSFSTSQGELKGKVLVEWEMGSGLSSALTLTREDIVTGEKTEVSLLATATSYMDTKDIKPGHVYRYTLTSTTQYKGQTYSKTAESLGWPSFYGTLRGRVQMHNGLGIAGAKVRISRKDPIDIPDVYEEDRLILKGVHEGLIAEMPPMNRVSEGNPPVFDSVFVREIITDDKGYFLLDSALYTSEGAKYDITIVHGACLFKYNDRQTANAQLTLSALRCEYEDIVFTSTNDKTIKGRLLYEKSTVPVRDAWFSLNGTPIHDADDKLVMTDNSGNFALTIPNAKVDSLKVMKDGHTIKGGGYILNKNGEREYQPEDLNGLTIWDQTKVRLVGRLAGGNRQGNQPLGFAMSRNNLGDDLTMILQLEGNNTAQIVYMDEHPDSTEINTTVQHPYQTAEQITAGKKDSTLVSYQRKRIVVKPSAVTGEFFVDLFPTKYKVTQLSAQGYNSLYSASEGYDILDLSTAVVPYDSVYEQRGEQYTYNAIYKRIYHQPVHVTATEFVRGKAVDYLGEGSIKDNNILGKEVDMPLYANGEYTFGYPVFDNGSRYTMQVQAHEDYFYNGDGALDKVFIEGGELLVRNGLADNQSDASYMLDSLGTATIFVDANNATFSLTGEDALRKLHFSVKLNGYYYEADPIEGFVTGVRYKGTDLITDAGLTVVDVLRDPPGSNSYSYLESGSQYTWENEHNIDITLSPTFTGEIGSSYTAVMGAWGGMGAGAFVGTQSNGGFTVSTTLTIPILYYQNYRRGSYELTLNDRIQTSSDPRDVGAMSDVYIGTVNTINFGRVETISVIDSATYAYCKAAIEKGQVRIISQGSANGKPYWLAIGEKMTAQQGASRGFAYSQKYIVGTLIPEMLSIISEKLIYTEDKAEVEALANAKKDVYYWSKVAPEDENYARTGFYEAVFPTGSTAEEFKEDLVAKAMNMVVNWILEIGKNEQEKLEARDKRSSDAIKQYSLAGTNVSHSEASAYYYKHLKRTTSGFGTGNGWNWGVGGDKTWSKDLTSSDSQDAMIHEEPSSETIAFTKAPGVSVSATISPGYNLSTSGGPCAKNYRNVTTGYEIGTNDGGYMDIDVYRDELITGDDAYDDLGWITEGSKEAKQVGNYIFVTRGGAARNPWTAPDSTLVYRAGQPLGNQLLKIENPKIYIDKPVVNNVPGDETATFVVRLANETELTQTDLTGYKPSNLTLYVEDATNPRGAKISMDGQPLTSGRTFVMAPGQTMEKVIEVKRGAQGYDYENIQLVFCDEYMTLHDGATLSVHYLPTSTPLRLEAPTDKWVLNTLSEPDDEGFFIPVTISDFKVGYENFDHIELQYKKQTEGESQWVTLCSWYCDSLAYTKGTGVKRLFDKGETKLNYAFHGEKDPMEMKYDLRAVSFCRLGTSFVTRSSDVVSGTKDTRCPQVFGMPTPASGILTYEDVIQLNFTEQIAYNYLDETSNFKVQGYTNKTDIAQSNTLHFPGTIGQMVQTEVTRNLNGRNFTIEMLAQTLEEGKTMVLFSHGNQTENMAFGVTDDGCLFARISSETFKSAPLKNYQIDISKALTHVGMLYNANSGKVRFFANTGVIANFDTNDQTSAQYAGVGVINLGKDDNQGTMYPFYGKMLDVRLWGTELSDNQISTLMGKHLSGNEKMLIGYWPMTETQGNIIADYAHGAFMRMSGGVAWDNVEGFSLKTVNKPVELDAEYLSTTNDNDNSITFWFKVDDKTGDGALLTFGSKQLPATNNGRLFLGFKKDKLVLTSNGVDYELGSAAAMANKNWHHFAMVVDRSRDEFAAYIDNVLMVQESASQIDGLSSDYAAFGDDSLQVHFDVFSQWDLALPSYVINDTYNSRYTGHEMGLHAYLPFTVYDTGEQGGLHADSCLLNAVYTLNERGEYVMSTRRLITGGFDAAVNLDKTAHAPIREMPSLENLDFSWSSTGTGLQININTNDKVINKEQIFVTVRGVEDLAGNVMKNPRMMTYFVDKNVLRWVDQERKMECDEGEADTIHVAWRNVSGRQLAFAIENAPSWLNISEGVGVVAPAQEKTLTLAVDAGLAAGNYACTLYLTDEMGLADALTLNVRVKPSVPEWFVDKTQWDRTMNLRGVVETKNCNGSYAIDRNREDLVAAFTGHQCVGVAHITVDDHSAYLMMTIYGNKEIAQDTLHNDLTFMLWNHETGAISELQHVVGDRVVPIHFKTNSVVGLPGDDTYSINPVRLRASDKKEQTIRMEKGWNWISLNVLTDELTDVNNVFVNQNDVFADGDVIKAYDYAQYDRAQGAWQGSLSQMDFRKVYQCFVAKEGSYKVMGRRLPADSLYVVVQSGTRGEGRWNDLPFLLAKSLSVNEALGDFQIGEKAQHGDIIKSMDEFIVADQYSGKWVGTLRYMQPGKGYYLLHHSGEAQAHTDTLRFHAAYALDGGVKPPVANSVASARETKLCEKEFSMPVIAQLGEDFSLSEGEQLAAYVAGEKVGEAQPIQVGGRTLLFISVRGNAGEKVSFVLERDGEEVASDARRVAVSEQGVLGSLDAPYVIDFSARTAEQDERLYDLQGRRLSGTLQDQRSGIYISNNKKIQK